MSGLKLEPRHLETLQRLFRQHLQEARVLAYGSRTTGNCHEGSDLDLAICHLHDPERAVTGVNNLRRAIEESEIPILVDLQEWYRLNEVFRAEIKRHSVIIWPEE